MRPEGITSRQSLHKSHLSNIIVSLVNRIDLNVAVVRVAQAHLASIITVRRQVSSELNVLLINRVLADIWQAEDKSSSEESQSRRNKERIATRCDLVIASTILKRRETV